MACYFYLLLLIPFLFLLNECYCATSEQTSTRSSQHHYSFLNTFSKGLSNDKAQKFNDISNKNIKKSIKKNNVIQNSSSQRLDNVGVLPFFVRQKIHETKQEIGDSIDYILQGKTAYDKLNNVFDVAMAHKFTSAVCVIGLYSAMSRFFPLTPERLYIIHS